MEREMPRIGSLAEFRAWCKWNAPAEWTRNVTRGADAWAACRIIFRNIGFRSPHRTEPKQSVLDELRSYINRQFLGAAA